MKRWRIFSGNDELVGVYAVDKSTAEFIGWTHTEDNVDYFGQRRLLRAVEV